MIVAYSPPWRSTVMVLGCVLPVAALLGMIVGLGILPLTLLAAGGVAALFFLALPTPFILTTLLVVTFLFVGLGLYYLRIDKLHWIPYAIATALWLKLPVDALRYARTAHRTASPPSLPLFVVALLCFFVVSITSCLVNETPLMNVLFGGKHYVLIWSVAFAIAAPSTSDQHVRRTWLLLLALAALQAPFATLQHFMAFGAGKNWDAVVGTFGGDPEGSGGGSGHLALFLLMALGVVLSLGKDRLVSPFVTGVVIVAIVLSVLMAETKVFFFVAPVVIGIVLWHELRRRPLTAIAIATGGALVLAGALVFYEKVYYDSVSEHATEADAGGVAKYLDYMFATDAKVGYINDQTGEVGRLETPLVWARDAAIGGAYGPLVGYGITASRASPLIGIGKAQKHFAFELKTTLVSVLLWDTGILGTTAFVAMLGLLGWSCWRYARHPRIPPFERSLFTGATAAVAVAFASLMYNDGLLDAPTLQITLAILLGFAWRWHRQLSLPAVTPAS